MYAKEQGRPCPMNAPIRTCLTLSFPQPIDIIAQKEPREDLKKEEKILYKLFKRCDEIGLVHQAIWIPSPNYTYVICNCCPCCCEVLSTRMEMKKEIRYHKKQLAKYQSKLKNLEIKQSKDKKDLEKRDVKNLQESIKYVRKQINAHQKGANMELSPIVARSAFVADVKNEEVCIDCGKCVQRCYFDARTMVHGKMHYNDDLCYGCGLCVSTCPENNIALVRRKKTKVIGKDEQNAITHTHPHHSH